MDLGSIASLTQVVWPEEAGPWSRHIWKSRDDATWLQAWSNEPSDSRLNSAIRSDSNGAVGCPGYFSDPREMDRLLQGSDIGVLADSLPGVFGVFRAGERGFQAITTAVRLHPVYYASVGDAHFAGNRAILVHAAARAVECGAASLSVRYNLRGLQSLIRSGYFVSDETPFEGVTALPAHATLDVSAGRIRVAVRPLPVVAEAVPGWRDERSLVRGLADDLIAAVAPLSAFSEPIGLSLTGGRDSRLIAAALHAAGIPFRTSTSGFPTHPDVVLAAQVARLLGVEHSSSPPPQDERRKSLVVEHPLRRTWEVIRCTEGMISAHNNVHRPAQFRIASRISGAGGEQLRGGFLAGQTNATSKAMRKRVDDLFLSWEDVFTDQANDRARQELEPWAARAARDPMGALDRLYLYYRTGRWSAAARAAAMAGHTTFDLLFDGRLNRSALAMSPEWRWSERPFHAAITRLASVLRDVPLTGKRWRYETEPPALPFRRRRWLARAPMVLDKQGSGFDWREKLDPVLTPFFREQILDGPAGLYELVRRPKMETLLATNPLSKASAVLLWNAYTVSVLLSDVWLSSRPQDPDVQIPLPAQG